MIPNQSFRKLPSKNSSSERSSDEAIQVDVTSLGIMVRQYDELGFVIMIERWEGKI